MADLTVKLPDGSDLELDEGASGADAAAAIGPGLAQGGARDHGRRRGPRPLGAARRRRGDRDRDRSKPEGALDAAAPRRRARDGDRRRRPVAGHEGLDRAADRGRLLLRLRVPRGRAARPERPARGSRRRCAAHIDGRRAVRAPRRARRPRRSSSFAGEDQPYKVELIEDLVSDEGVETVSLYRNGPFEDLCRGPHGPSTGRIEAFKLNSLAGAYWRGDETRQMLTRIYGTAFFSEKELRGAPRAPRAGARARPPPPRPGARPLHASAPRRPGCRSGFPNGTVLLRLIEAEVRAQLAQARLRRDQDAADPRRGALAPLRPLGQLPREHVLRRAAERDRDERRFALKPMNCPGACLVYASEPPLLPRPAAAPRRVRPGLALRARGRAPRAAAGARLHPGRRPRLLHARPDRRRGRLDICEAIDELYATFGFDDVRVELSTRPEKSIGTDEQWEAAEAALRKALERPGARVQGQPRRRRLLRAEDRLPRHRRARALLAVRHLPGRLLHARALRAHLSGRRQRRAPAGDDPPRPARLDGALRRDPDRALRRPLPALAGAASRSLVLPGRRPHTPSTPRRSPRSCARRACAPASTRARSRSARKIRDAELSKAPYMLVVGEREQEAGAVAVRSHDEGDLGTVPAGEFVDSIAERIASRATA